MSFRNDGLWRKASVLEYGPGPLFFFKLFILVVAGLSLRCCSGFSLAAECRGHSPVALLGLFTAVASPVEQGLQGAWAPVVVASRLQSTGWVVVMHQLNCSLACELFPDQGLNPCLLHWQADSLPLSHQGNPSPTLVLWVVLGNRLPSRGWMWLEVTWLDFLFCWHYL